MHLLQTAPPYRRFRPIAREALKPVRGAVVALCLEKDGGGVGGLVAQTVEIRHTAPWAPIVLCDPSRLPPPAAALAAAGIRTVIPGGDPDPQLLGSSLTDPGGLPVEIAQWLRTTNREISAGTLEAVRRTLRSSQCETATGRGCSVRTVNRKLRQAGLPSIGWWCAAGNCLRGLLLLQRKPGALLIDGAFEAGYVESTAFSRACLNRFGSRPSVLRGILGWEWALWSALLRRR